VKKTSWDKPQADWLPLLKAARSIREEAKNRVASLREQIDARAKRLEFPATSPNRSDAAQLISEMLWLFQREIIKGARHVLYGRTPTLLDEFEEIPADIRSSLKILDWREGTAVVLNSLNLRRSPRSANLPAFMRFSELERQVDHRQVNPQYWSIHVKLDKPTVQTKKGRKSEDYWSAVKQHVFELLDYHGLPQSHDPDWKSQADVERAALDFIQKRFSKGASESSVRKYVKEFISEYKSKARK